MKELCDLFSKIIHSLQFLLFFLLVHLITFKDCVPSGFLLRLILILNSKRLGRTPLGETLDCSNIHRNEKRVNYNALLLHGSSHNSLPNTSLPLGCYRTTQNRLQQHIGSLNAGFLNIPRFCYLPYFAFSTIGLVSVHYLPCSSPQLFQAQGL